MPHPEFIIMRLFFQIQVSIICLLSSINFCFAQSSTDNYDFYAFDSIFKTAMNSPAYVVASKADILALKKNLKLERDSLSVKLKNQEIELSQLKSQTLPTNPPSPIEENPQAAGSSSSSYLLFQLIIALLVGVVIYFFMKDFSIKKEVREAKDSYKNLVSEFEDHKKKAIERERKLMRKVIDLQNNLEEKSSPTAWFHSLVRDLSKIQKPEKVLFIFFQIPKVNSCFHAVLWFDYLL